MPCYHPISIINPSKYVSLRYRDRFLLRVPCGKCAYCQKQRSNHWYYRSYWESQKVFDSGVSSAFVLFDTLTYRDGDLPHFSDFISLPKNLDFPCFNSSHLRLFVAALRQVLKRKYNSNFTYFVSAEYGTSCGYTHRPHYHVLFYVVGDIQPLELSALVARYWKYGRTDGIPYKTSGYVLSNTFRKNNANSLRCCKYVSKYVQKSCTFQKTLRHRISSIMKYVASRCAVDMSPDEWLSTRHADRVRFQLIRRANQFHRQSTEFGAYALESLDVSQLFKTGSLYLPDSTNIVLPIGLPMYYKRKLFYKLVEVDGSKLWIPTEFGLEYLKVRESYNKKYLIDNLSAVKVQYHLSFDEIALSDYVMDYRGRIRALRNPSTLEQRLEKVDLYNYVTLTDREHLEKLGLYSKFLGNSYLGYRYKHKLRSIPFKTFIKNYVYLDESKESILDEISELQETIDGKKQGAYALKQRLTNLYHHLFP